MTRISSALKRNKALFSTTGALLLFAGASCQQHGVCDDVSGSCLALRVEGDGPFDTLRTTLTLSGKPDTMRSGDTTGDPPGIDLPVTLRVVPPDGVSASQVSQVAVAGLRSDVVQANAASDSGFTWPDDSHIDLTLVLANNQNLPDGGSDDMPPPNDMPPPSDMPRPGDMSQPPGELKWRPETNPGKVSLYGVWAGSDTQAYTVGEKGTVLTRQSDATWHADPSGTMASLNAVSGIAGGNLWSTGDAPGSWRRDNTKWNVDSTGLNLGTGGTLYSVTVGATAGELWAGDRDGQVWHRTGSATANGAWGNAERVFPAGNAVYGIASAGGAVFAVGSAGYVAFRKDSAAGTAWAPFQYPSLPTGGNATWNGVWAFDKSDAVAVGTNGLLIRYTGGTWQTTPQTVNPQGAVLFSVWGQSASRVWAVGENGLIIRVEGTKATQLANDNTQRLYSVFGLNETDIFAVGIGAANASLILHGTP